jgi:two-component system, NarL family, response regulator LiaR
MSIRVLVVDDDADFRSMITLTLEPENDMTVIGEAGDGETGVALALTKRPDVVLMDLTMPRLDGFEATKQIKRDRPEVKVLVVTSAVDTAIRHETYKSGADALLGKRDITTALVPTIRHIT